MKPKLMISYVLETNSLLDLYMSPSAILPRGAPVYMTAHRFRKSMLFPDPCTGTYNMGSQKERKICQLRQGEHKTSEPLRLLAISVSRPSKLPLVFL